MDNPAENDWTSAYNPIQYENNIESPEDKSNQPEKKKREGKPLLITIQLIISLLLLVSFYALRVFLPDTFTELRSWYEKNLNNEIIISESFENFSLDNLINALKDK